MNQDRIARSLPVTAIVAALLSLPFAAAAQQRQVPDTYTAITVNMTPADVELKADILQWSTPEQRAAAIAAMTGSDDPVAALQDLPTLGVVWRSGSAVGSAIKYAAREVAADGSELVTLVTDKRVGSTSFTPWTADDPAVETPPGYSVIQMSVADGGGSGTMSLAARVVIDADAGTVALARAEGTPVLTSVIKVPKPYWADAGD